MQYDADVLIRRHLMHRSIVLDDYHAVLTTFDSRPSPAVRRGFRPSLTHSASGRLENP